MTNVEKYTQMKYKASEALFKEHDKKKSDELDHKASLFAKANFSEADFDEYINTCYGYEKFLLTKWKNRILQERAAKAIVVEETKKQLSF